MTLPFMPILGARKSETNVTWDSGNMGASCVLSNSNYDVIGAANQCLRATKSISGSQKAYFELVCVTASTNSGRIGTINHSTYSALAGSTSQGATGRVDGGSFNATGVTAGSVTSIGGTSANGKVYMVAVDMGAGKIWMGDTNTWWNSGNPASGTNHQYSGLTGTHYPAADFLDSTEVWRIRANSSLLTYSPPAGFTVLGAL